MRAFHRVKKQKLATETITASHPLKKRHYNVECLGMNLLLGSLFALIENFLEESLCQV